jgi:hypothetical protein
MNKINQILGTQYNIKLAQEVMFYAKEIPVIAEFDATTKKFIVGFVEKLSAYSLYIEYYKCNPTIRCEYSLNLKCWCVYTGAQ